MFLAIVRPYGSHHWAKPNGRISRHLKTRPSGPPWGAPDDRHRPPQLGGARDASQSTQRNVIKTISGTNHVAKPSQPVGPEICSALHHDGDPGQQVCCWRHPLHHQRHHRRLKLQGDHKIHLHLLGPVAHSEPSAQQSPWRTHERNK